MCSVKFSFFFLINRMFSWCSVLLFVPICHLLFTYFFCCCCRLFYSIHCTVSTHCCLIHLPKPCNVNMYFLPLLRLFPRLFAGVKIILLFMFDFNKIYCGCFKIIIVIIIKNDYSLRRRWLVSGIYLATSRLGKHYHHTTSHQHWGE